MNNLPPGVLTKQASMESMETEEITHVPVEADRRIRIESNNEIDDSISVSQWLISMILFMIPIINIVSVLVCIKREEREEKRNWAKASMIVLLVSYLVQIIAFVLLKNITLSQMLNIL